MRKLQTQGAHHITLVGAGRQTSIDFWEGVLFESCRATRGQRRLAFRALLRP